MDACVDRVMDMYVVVIDVAGRSGALTEGLTSIVPSIALTSINSH